MNPKTEIDLEGKINDCLENKSKHIEWLCQNKTEKQLEKLLKQLEKLYEFASLKQITHHIELIALWKEVVTTAIKNLSNYENLYAILKKLKRKKKLTSYEKMIVDINYDWVINRLYDVIEEETSIENIQPCKHEL